METCTKIPGTGPSNSHRDSGGGRCHTTPGFCGVASSRWPYFGQRLIGKCPRTVPGRDARTSGTPMDHYEIGYEPEEKDLRQSGRGRCPRRDGVGQG